MTGIDIRIDVISRYLKFLGGIKMKDNRLRFGALSVICFAFISSNLLFAQQWSADQQEVWQALENWFELRTKNDAQGVKALIHKDFVGWGWDLYATYGHAELTEWADHMTPKGTEFVYHILKPMEILVMDDVAVLYFFGSFFKTVDGKEMVEQAQFTNVWKKEDGKWLLIASTGSNLPTN